MQTPKNNAFLEFLERYGPKAGPEGPVRFVREVLGADPDPWQEGVLLAFGRGERRISIRACHGPGKTAVAAWLVCYMMFCRFPQKTVATAPSRGQLEDALVAEVEKWMKRLPPALLELVEIKKNRIELRAASEESFFTARTARAENPEALQGVHSEHVLLIADEASGVPEAIFEAAAGSMSGHSATTLLLSNPVRSSGFFFDTHSKLKDLWYTVQVSAADSPRVTDDFVYDIARRYGENSNAYRIRVLGEFPLADLDTIIPFEFVESARNRDIELPGNLDEIWGLDVARFGDDYNALVRRTKLAVMPDIDIWMGKDLMKTAGRVKALWDSLPPHQRPSEILVDVIGLGAGVVDRLREQKLPVRGVNVSETASVEEEYRNLRTELWFTAREWLATRDRKLPSCEGVGGCARDCPHEQLAAELVVPKFDYTSSGKLLMESKRDIKKRIHRSTNVADAFALTFASEPVSLLRGSSDRNWRTNWHDELRRGRSVV